MTKIGSFPFPILVVAWRRKVENSYFNIKIGSLLSTPDTAFKEKKVKLMIDN